MNNLFLNWNRKMSEQKEEQKKVDENTLKQ